MTRLSRPVFALTLLLVQSTAVGCGAGGGQPAAEPSKDEERAANLLERARAAKDAERYRRLLTRFPDTRAAADAREELAAVLVADAEAALKANDHSTADDRAEEATRFAGLALTQKAREIQKKVDEGRAERIGAKASQAATEGKCASALKLVASPLREKPRAAFTRALQDKSKASLESCLTRRMDEEIKAGNVDAARALLASPDTTTALDQESFKKLEAALKKSIVQHSTGEIKPLLEAEKWKEAFTKLDELEKAGKLGAAERPIANELVRDAVGAKVLAWSKEALTAKKPSELAKKIDAAIATAAYPELPPEIATARAKVKTATECEKLQCKLVKPAAAWTWGAVDVRPATDSAAEPAQKLEHARKVWVLAQAPARQLVSVEDPGAAEGAALYDKATGWVDGKQVKPTDTSLWLPPNDQLEKVLVWAPLRAPSKDYHLGRVKKVEGRKATVERLADKAAVVVDTATLRVGSLEKGLRVMAFCVDQVHTEPAKIDSVVSAEGGVPRVKIACDKGDVSRVEIGSALVTKGEWLPARKP